MSAVTDDHTSETHDQQTGSKPPPKANTLPDGDYIITCVATPTIAWGYFDPDPKEGSWVSSAAITETPGQRWTLKNTRNGFTLSNVANPTYYATNTEVAPSRFGVFQVVQANTTSATWTLQPAGQNGAYLISPTNNLNVVVFQGAPYTWVLMAPPGDIAPELRTATWWNFVAVADS